MNTPAATIRIAVVVLLLAAGGMAAEQRFPPPDFESGYRLPDTAFPAPASPGGEIAAVVIMAAALTLAAWLALKKRSRRGMWALSIFSLVYFGFIRKGCVCPIGAIQNVTLALADPGYALPFTVVLIFALPLLFALLFGRVFCGGVCPLGAIQDLVLIRPLRLPRWLQEGLGVLPALYLGLAVLYAATDTMFIICAWDPFIGLFRLSGPVGHLILGGVVLLAATCIGRPYCRFACPYGVLLGIASRFSKYHATITPDDCVVCGLCDTACPFDAIRRPTPEGVSEES